MKRIKKTYRLTLEDRSRLREIKSVTLSSRRAILLGFAFLIGLIAIFLLIFIPLRNRTSYYATQSSLREMALRIDSLKSAADVNNRFMENLREVFDTERTPHDSVRAGISLKSLPLDSLITSSPAERRFMASMSEKEKYNLQVLAPIAADGMIFSNPAPEGIVAEKSDNSFQLRMIVPLGSTVCSMADGIVLDTYNNDKSGKYTIIIQHPNGFVSRYSEVGTPLVENGMSVYSGQVISTPVTSPRARNSATPVCIELWHDGTPLYPFDYLL